MRSLLSKWRKASTAELREYLYIDEDRLNGYVNQLRNPISYDKVPVWSAELSATGPVAKAQQTRLARAYTIHERLSFLEAQLRDRKQLLDKRWSGAKDVENELFRIESCLARRIVIAHPREEQRAGIWISRYDPKGRTGQPRTLLLLEAVRTSDEPATFYSTLSWLIALMISAAPTLFTPATMQPLIDRSDDPDWLARLSNALTADPFTFFRTDFAGQLFPQRAIRAFYRIRNASLSSAPGMIPVAVSIGYPISIAEELQVPEEERGLYMNDAGSGQLTRKEYDEHVSIGADLLRNMGATDDEVAKFKVGLLARFEGGS